MSLFFVEVYHPLMVGVSHPLSKESLYTLLNKIIPIKKKSAKELNFKKLQTLILKRLSKISLSEYDAICLSIQQTPFNLSTKCFYKEAKMIEFLDYMLFIHRLCICLKIFLLFPLLKQLQKIENQPNTQNDIFLKTSKSLKNWLFQAFVISYNGAKFDNVLLFNSTLPSLLTNKGIKITFQKSGSSFVNLWYQFRNDYKTYSSPLLKTKKKSQSPLKLPSSTRLCFKVSFAFRNIVKNINPLLLGS